MTTQRGKQLHLSQRVGSQGAQRTLRPSSLRCSLGALGCTHPPAGLVSSPHLHPLRFLTAQPTPRGLTVYLKADTQERSPQTVLLLDNLLHFRSRLQMATLKTKIRQPNLQAFFQLAIIYTNNYKTTWTPLQLVDNKPSMIHWPSSLVDLPGIPPSARAGQTDMKSHDDD